MWNVAYGMREVRKARAKQAGVELTAQAATISEMTRKGVVLGGTHVAGSKFVLRTGDETLRTEALVCMFAAIRKYTRRRDLP